MEKSQLIVHAQDAIRCLRIQNYRDGSEFFRGLLQEMQEEADVKAAMFEEDALKQMLSQMLKALEAEDMVLLADLLEEALLPLLKEMIIPEETVICGNYSIESTSSGLPTVKHLASGRYLHSNTNPMEEAELLAAYCFDPSKENYAVWGCGLGYHIARLYEEAIGAVFITVFDEDKEILKIAEEYGILGSIPKENIKYVEDASGAKFAAYIEKNDAGILMHAPSIKKIQNKALKDALTSFLIGWNGTMQYRNRLAINFRSNQKHCSHNVDELEEAFRGREVVVVAAGPSLDHNLEFLRKVSGSKVIIAVGTVWKKLLSLDIVPDYVVVMDAQLRTFRQFEGIEDTRVPLILDSTACWKFAAAYKGKKYIAYQKDYEASEKCAAQSHNKLYETGGSVTTLALEIALQSGAKTVYFAGADFAYPAGLSHADGTMDKKHIQDVSGMEQVKAVNGGVVYANAPFIDFRKWIERKIKQYPEVAFYNLSDCGADIEGAVPFTESF